MVYQDRIETNLLQLFALFLITLCEFWYAIRGWALTAQKRHGRKRW